MKTFCITFWLLIAVLAMPAFATMHDNGDGTITDSETGLTWQQTPDTTARTWEEALSYFNGQTEWRLPSRHELQSIVDYEQYDPALDTNAFPGTNGTFWTSTTSATSDSSAYTVDVTSGAVGTADKDSNSYQAWPVSGGGSPVLPETFFTANSDGTVTDNRTGLVWAPLPADVDGTPGADSMGWKEAMAYCTILEFPGQTDWRLPSRHELQSIADYRYYNPAIDSNFFSVTNGVFWTSTTSATSDSSAYQVDFTSGSVGTADKDANSYHVLAVRSGGNPTPPEDYLVNNGNGTVFDKRTNLVWTALPADVDGTPGADSMTWQAALAHCAASTVDGQADWRLPSRHELQSIADYRWYNPAIDSNFFSATNGVFWTSTTSATSDSSAYQVDFTSGSVGTADKDANSYHVLAVRSGGTPIPPETTFRNNYNGTVIDTRTGLIWRQAPLDGGSMDWQDALAEATDLYYAGRGDWRLPSRHELQSIADYRWYNPAIDTNFFSSINGAFWTSTTSATSDSSAYQVDFTSGSVGTADKDSNSYQVMVVAGTPPSTISGSFKFFGIPAQVVTNTPFVLDLVAEDSDFDGTVYLNTEEGGGVVPTSVTFVNGRWQGNISITRPGYTRLAATLLASDALPLSGRSDWFEVVLQPGGSASADLEVSIAASKTMYSEGDVLDYSVYVQNIGTDRAPDVDIIVEYSEGFDAQTSWYCRGIDDAACTAISTTGSIGRFNAHLAPGENVKVWIWGFAKAGYESIQITAQAYDAAVSDPILENNSAVSLIRTEIPDLHGSQDTELRALPGSSNDPLGADTLVLTHGLQKGWCDDKEFWTYSKSDPAQAGYLIRRATEGEDLNIYQFVWKGACQAHVAGVLPTGTSYIRARQNVYLAAQQLAKKLIQELGLNYDGKIQFIGHSLGTAVNAYAADIFLRKATQVTEAQITILDHPNRIGKIAFFMDEDEAEKKWGFDKDFFANVLPFDRAGLTLYVDNYHADEKDTTKLGSFGVGTDITGDVYNRELHNPHEVGDKLLSAEFDHDHSGVHQWYRWTIQPQDDENFTGNNVCPSDKWNNLPEGVNVLLDPCQLGDAEWQWKIGGWSASILNSNSLGFPDFNGENSGPTNSTAVETSGNQPYGCSADSGNFISVVCTEAPSSAPDQAYAAKASMVYAMDESNEIPKSYIELDITVPEFLRYISFDYSFSNIGDGDYVYIFLDGVIIWKMSGEALTPGEIIDSGMIPLRADPGDKKLIIALYGVGEQNAQFSMNNFKFTTVADTDGDGYGDDDDVFPDDPNEWEDTDGDGTGNNADLDDDGDGIPDVIEEGSCTDPLSPDSDSDTLPDDVEDVNLNGIVDPGETSPCLQDSDGDGADDNVDNCPVDGTKTEPRVCGCGIPDLDTDGDDISDCHDADDDNDNIPDVIEDVGCSDPLDADTDDDGLLDGEEDTDLDGITDVDETDLCNADTDGDGYNDYEEINAGSDPLDKNSTPFSNNEFPWIMFLPAIIGNLQ